MTRDEIVRALEALIKITTDSMLKGGNSIQKNIELNGRLKAYKEVLEMIKNEN